LVSLGTKIHRGQRVLVTGAAGNVGRSAVFTAKVRGAFVVAGVRESQLQDATDLGADEVVALDDDRAIASLRGLDAVADTINGETAEKLIEKVKEGGVFASVLGAPQNADRYPAVKFVPIYAQADAKTLLQMVQAVATRKLRIPIIKKLPLKDAEKAHAAVEKGAAGKVLLVMAPA
jgi:NADPH:quinone reductase-like Zn-dependent oxidoreductase